MKTGSFGLDIGTSSLKLVWLAEDKKIISVKSALAIPAPAKGLLSESPFDQEEMANTVRKLLDDAKVTTNTAHIALADNQVYTKVIEMPVLSEKELSSAIYWEAEQQIPAALDTITLDWQVLRSNIETPSGPKMQVLLVGAPQALVSKYQSILELGGISIMSVETEMLSVIRSLVVQGTNPITTVLVNIGSLSTSIAVVQNGVLIFTYAVAMGGMAINRAIATEFGFTTLQAEEYKKIYGVTDENLGGKIRHAIEPILTSLVTEIKKAVTYYSEKYKNDAPVTQVVLCGGTARLPGIDVFFVEKLGLETVIANAWKTRSIANVTKELDDNASDYAIAVGLALKDFI